VLQFKKSGPDVFTDSEIFFKKGAFAGIDQKTLIPLQIHRIFLRTGDLCGDIFGIGIQNPDSVFLEIFPGASLDLIADMATQYL